MTRLKLDIHSRCFSGRALALIAVLILQSCSMKSSSGDRTIRISLPAVKSSARALASSVSRTGFYDPTSKDDFTCFAINVTGAGVTPDGRLSCTGGSPVGKLGGLASADGGTIEMTVPSGPGRQIQVFAYQSKVGCGSLDTILNGPVGARFEGYSKPYLLGQATADIFTDTTVAIHASFDPAHPTQIFTGCGGDTDVPSLGKSRASLAAATFDARPVAMTVAAGGTCGHGGRPCLNASATIGGSFSAMSQHAATGRQALNLDFETLGSHSTGGSDH